MVQAQLQNRLTEAARQNLQNMAEMKPDRKETFLTLANVCYVLKDYDGMASSIYIIPRLRQRIDFIAPVHVYPGEDEMEALALNAIGALKGELPIQVYE